MGDLDPASHGGADETRPDVRLLLEPRLENIPEEGVVARRHVSAAEAKALIEQARRDGSLLCVTADDLLAPYKRECEKHNDLCRA